MNTLKLFIDAGWPHAHEDCDWVVCDASCKVLQHGHGEARYWPGIDAAEAVPMACELILSCDQAVCLWVRLPSGKAGRNPDVVAYAIEADLIEDVENCHVVAGLPSDQGDSPVIAMSSRRLRTVLDTLARIGIHPYRVVVDAQLPPAMPGSWTVMLHGQNGSMNTEQGWLHLDKAAGRLPAELAWALRAAGDARPGALIVHCANPAICDSVAWSREFGVSVELRQGLPLSLASNHAVNLLQGDFAIPRRRDFLRSRIRHARRLIPALVVLVMAAVLGEWLILSYQVRHLREEEAKLFSTVFPAGSAMVDPALQLQRLADDERLGHGMLGDDDLLTLLSRMRTIRATIIRLEYRAGHMKVGMKLPAGYSSQMLLSDLANDGLKGRLIEATANHASVDISR